MSAPHRKVWRWPLRRAGAEATFDLASVVASDAVVLLRAAGRGERDDTIRAAVDLALRLNELLTHYDIDLCAVLLKERGR